MDVIECLLNAGAKIDARTEWGDLPIHYAACWGTHQVLEYLFEEGSPVDKPAAGKQSSSDKVLWWNEGTHREPTRGNPPGGTHPGEPTRGNPPGIS